MKFTSEKGKFVHDSLNVEYTSYLPENSDEQRGVTDDTAFLVGSDYASVYVTSDKDNITKFLDMLTDEDMEELSSAIGTEEIIVSTVGNWYILFTEGEVLHNELYDFLSESFIGFGGEMDDVAISDCVLAANYVRDEGIDASLVIEMYENSDFVELDVEDPDELECSADALARILEYNSSSVPEDEIVLFLVEFAELVDVEEID